MTMQLLYIDLFRYIEELRPDYIQIENVVEFMEWGPLVIKGAVGSRGEAFCPLEIKEAICMQLHHEDAKQMQATA